MQALDPESILPAQFFASARGLAGLTGERRLMFAVLEDAVYCYQSGALSRDPRARREFEEAREWMESRDRAWPFSYENVCETLGIDASVLRAGLRASVPSRELRQRRKPSIVPRVRTRLQAGHSDSEAA